MFFFSLGYRPFMMILQSQVTLLDRYVIQQESIPNMLPPLGARHVPLQFVNRGSDVTNSVGKNVCIPVKSRHILLLLVNVIFAYFFYLKNQNMLSSKSASFDTQLQGESNRTASTDISNNRQRLNKSMSESHIDTSRIRRNFENTHLDSSTIDEQSEQNDQDAEAKTNCVLM